MGAVFFRSSLGRLRAIGMLEGLSFLVLLGVAMPLKYLAGMPEMVRVVGMAHGVLFMLFGLAVVQVAVERRWPLTRVVAALAASVLPFGPFVLDARLLRREEQADAQAGAGSAHA
jgi:integral membrane protein